MHWPLDRPLPLQPFLCAQNMSLPCIRISRIIPPALSSALPHVEWASPRSCCWTGHDAPRNASQETYLCSFLVEEILSASPLARQPRTLTHMNHQWLLPPAKLQRVPYVPPPEQRVEQRVISCEDQHMADNNVDPPILTRITDVPPIIAAPNPTTKQALKLTKQTHSQQTRNNIPGGVPPITNVNR